MTEKIELSKEEEWVLEPILTAISRVAQRDFTLSDLLEKWMRFVLSVEHGYNDSIYEYTNDLSVRELLEKVTDASPQSLRNKLLKELKAWDDRLMAVTKPAPQPLMERKGEKPAWWWFRIPSKPGNELRSDLQTERLDE